MWNITPKELLPHIGSVPSLGKAVGMGKGAVLL